jgi:hypothetical protein
MDTTDQATQPTEPPAQPPAELASPDPEPPDPEPGASADPTPADPDADADADPADADPVEPSAPEPPEEERWAAFAPVAEKAPGRLRRTAGRFGHGLVHEWTLATAGAIALAVLMTWPALRYPQYTLPQDTQDPALVAWLLTWPGHILLTDPAQLWHGNAFFPERWSYAFTDSLLGYAPAGLIGDGPADALLRYNVIFVLVHALAFLGAYALVRQLGVDRIAALVAGLAFAYAPWRLAQAGHLHVLSTGGIALALAMLVRGHGWSLRYGFRRSKVRPGWIIAGWLVAAWQVSLGFGIGLPFVYVMAGIAVVVALAWLVRRIARRRRQPIGRIIAANLIGGVVFAAVAVLMALPYLTVVDQHPQARRNFGVLHDFSPPVQGFVIAPAESWLWGGLHEQARQLVSWPPEMALLPGFALIALAVAGLFYSVWSVRVRLLLAAALAASVVLAMGTEFFGGAVYRPLHEWLPGWDALRTPGRLIIWTTLLLAVLAAGALAGLRVRARDLSIQRWGTAAPVPWLRMAMLVPVVLVLLEGLNTTPHPVVPPMPPALAAVDGPILVLPSDQATDQLVMLWSTDGFPPVVNGGSGFTPASLTETRELTQTFPDQQSVSHLRSLGVATVVVLPDLVVGTAWERALAATGAQAGITREDIDGAVVFHLGSGTGPA